MKSASFFRAYAGSDPSAVAYSSGSATGLSLPSRSAVGDTGTHHEAVVEAQLPVRNTSVRRHGSRFCCRFLLSMRVVGYSQQSNVSRALLSNTTSAYALSLEVLRLEEGCYKREQKMPMHRKNLYRTRDRGFVNLLCILAALLRNSPMSFRPLR
jgi:hypothetical protein